MICGECTPEMTRIACPGAVKVLGEWLLVRGVG